MQFNGHQNNNNNKTFNYILDKKIRDFLFSLAITESSFWTLNTHSVKPKAHVGSTGVEVHTLSKLECFVLHEQKSLADRKATVNRTKRASVHTSLYIPSQAETIRPCIVDLYSCGCGTWTRQESEACSFIFTWLWLSLSSPLFTTSLRSTNKKSPLVSKVVAFFSTLPR